MKRTTTSLAMAAALAAFGCKKEAAPEATTETKTAALVAEASEGPSDIVYAASSAIRVIDFARGEVVAEVPLGKAVTDVEFAPDGTAFVAASDGLHMFDGTTHAEIAKLTDTPVRQVDVADDGKTVSVLSHQVIVNEDQSREVLPFFLQTVDVASKTVASKETIGQLIFYAARRVGAGGHDVVVTEKGDVRTLSGSQPLSGEGLSVDPIAGLGGGDQPHRVRHEAVRHGSRAYIPVEAYPSRILIVDLKTGETSGIALDRAYPLRGLAVSPDGSVLVANVGIGVVVVDLATREIRDRIETPDPTSQIAFSSDGRYVYTAQVVDGTGGAIHAISLNPPKHVKKIHLDDISPWALGVRPR